jgi:hypothetical protein
MNGKSWRTTVAAIINAIGGVGILVAQTGIADTKIGGIITGISSAIMILGTTFGFISAKDKNVSGVGDNAYTQK